jgi:hypothetical protein
MPASEEIPFNGPHLVRDDGMRIPMCGYRGTARPSPQLSALGASCCFKSDLNHWPPECRN